ncbi:MULTISPECIES: hypothetical protein [unclassified Streptomyces]|nr:MULTISPECIES: hypothetical protein [unclassified Streptomyces]WPO72151.1 hypothetical protein R9806_16665 [Streptomyces sp. KN37]
MLLAPTAASLIMLALFVLAMKSSDVAPLGQPAEPAATPDRPTEGAAR